MTSHFLPFQTRTCGPSPQRTGRLAGLIAGLVLSACAQAHPAEPVAAITDPGCGAQICTKGAALRAAYEGPITSWPAVETTDNTPFEEMAPLPAVEAATDARLTALGQDLFFDPILSASGQIACASCHHPGLAFTDGVRSSTGHDRQEGRRNAPTLLDKAGQQGFMWDGAAETLEDQAVMPIANPVEMANEHALAAASVNEDAGYSARFAELTGRDTVEIGDIADALAAYERTLTRKTRFDRFLAGDRDMLSDQELFGLHLFRTKARCMTCHSGPRFTDGQFHNIGLHYFGRKYEDLGRYALTDSAKDVGGFLTPSLRHVSRTSPYMHNGLFPSLRGIVNLYDRGGARPKPRPEFADDPLFPETSPLLVELGLTPEEKDALVAYLETL